MKKTTFVLFLLVSCHAHAWMSGNIPGTPPDFVEEDDAMLGFSRFWSYYNPYPSNYIGSR